MTRFLRRHRFLAAFLLADLVLAGLIAAAASWVFAPASPAPLPLLVAALPSLTPPGSPTYPVYPTLPTEISGSPAPSAQASLTATFAPLASETAGGGSLPAASLSTATPTTPATPTQSHVPPTRTASPPPSRTSPPAASRPSATPDPTATTTLSPVASQTPPPTVIPSTVTSVPATNPPPPPPVPPAGFVGMNGGPIEGNNSVYPYEGNLDHNPLLRDASFSWLARAGVQWYRNYASDDIVHSWSFVEQQPGVFDWSAWDILVTSAQNNQLNLLASIGNSVPPWANGSANWRNPPSDLYSDPWEATAWYRFVAAIVERYDGDGQADMPGLTRPIKYWEVWNEPDLRDAGRPPDYPARQFNGNAQDYVRLLAVAYSAIKHADAAATVVGPAISRIPGFAYDPKWTMWDWASFVNAGGLNYVDVVSFHIYFDRTVWDPDGVAELVLNAVDANRGGKPVWLTETGWEGNPGADHADKARNLVRSALIFWARPFMDRYFWYSWQESETHEGSDHKGLLQSTSGVAAVGVEPDPLFHPAYRALAVMNRVLAGYGPAQRPATLDVGGAARVYKFNANGREVWVAWNRQTSGTTTIALDTGGRTLRLIGLYGEDLGTFAGGSLTLGPNPLYLTTDLNWNQNLGRITGRVRVASLGATWANGAAGVTVQLSGPVSASTTTNSAGTYVFESLPDGVYTVGVAGLSQSATVGRELPWGRTSFTVP